MKKIFSSIALCMLVMVLFVSCSKEGPAGATGPAGPAGAAGAAGPAGPAGVPGAAGTANVIYSAWLDVSYAIDTIITTVTPQGTFRDTSYYALIPAPKLTADLLNRGDVKIYWNQNTATNPVVVPLPFFNGGVIINPFFFINQAGAGTIELDANANFSTGTLTGNIKYFQYRYILIPGGTTARNMIDWNDYNAVKAYLKIPD